MSKFNSRWKQSSILFFLLSVSVSAWSQAADHSQHKNHSKHQDHSAHLKMMSKTHFKVSDESYVIPNEILLNESGTKIELKNILNQQQPIALNFIFTTCSTICPVMTATFAQMRRQLGKASEQVQLVSITIDPEYDRPEVLKSYAAKFGVSEGWTFLTGEGNSINHVLRSFDVYAGSKMNHQPITLFKNPKSPTWIRLDGLASGKEMANLVKKRLLN